MSTRKIALQHGDRFVCAEDTPLILTLSRDAIGPWETLTETPNGDGTVSFKTAHGFYVCAEQGGNGPVHANRDSIGPWESFTPLEGDGRIAYRTWDDRHYLGVAEGETLIQARAELPFWFTEIEIEAAEEPLMPMPRLVARGTQLAEADGGVWFGKGVSFFRGFEKFLNGGAEAIRPQLDQLGLLGCNTVDVWAMYANINTRDKGLPPFNLYRQLGAYDQLFRFHELLAAYDLRALWVGFTDLPMVNMSQQADQISHWQMLSQTLDRIDNIATIILNNEPEAHDFNVVDRSRFPKIARHPYAISSYGDGLPPLPHGDVFAYHHPRELPKVVKDACVVDHPGFVAGKPVWLDEPIRVDPNLAHDAAQAPRVIEMMAGTAAGSACGIVFHSQHGKHAELYDSYTMERAVAFFGALKGV